MVCADSVPRSWRAESEDGAGRRLSDADHQAGAPLGSLDLVSISRHASGWGRCQGSLAKFDVKSKFQTGAPTFKERDEARIAMVMPINHDIDGQVWIGGDNEYQVDVKTGQWKAIDYSTGLKDRSILRELSSYGVASDSKNNFYGLNLNGTYIIRVDAKTKQVIPYPTPTPNAGPRRGHMDAQDGCGSRNRANKTGCSIPGRRSSASSGADANGRTSTISPTASYAWRAMNNDRIVGSIPQWRPSNTCCRATTSGVSVDNATSRPALLGGNNLRRRSSRSALE